MKVADMSIEELKVLIKGAVKGEVEELLDVKHRIFELETLIVWRACGNIQNVWDVCRHIPARNQYQQIGNL